MLDIYCWIQGRLILLGLTNHFVCCVSANTSVYIHNWPLTKSAPLVTDPCRSVYIDHKLASDGVENTQSAAILWAIYTDLHEFATRGALLESGQLGSCIVPCNSILSYISPLVYTRKGQISLCAVKTTKCSIWPFRDNQNIMFIEFFRYKGIPNIVWLT